MIILLTNVSFADNLIVTERLNRPYPIEISGVWDSDLGFKLINSIEKIVKTEDDMYRITTTYEKRLVILIKTVDINKNELNTVISYSAILILKGNWDEPPIYLSSTSGVCKAGEISDKSIDIWLNLCRVVLKADD